MKELHELGGGLFEIANHTEHHKGVAGLSHQELTDELTAIDAQCAAHGIPPTTTFCYPGYGNTPQAVEAQPAGQAPVPSVLASRSHASPPVAVPVHVAVTASHAGLA